MPDAATPVDQLKNLGSQTAEWLRDVGIHTRADLETVGAAMAYRMLRHHFYGVNRLALYALFGALEDRHWTDYSPEEKARMTRATEGAFSVRYEA